MNIAQNHSSKPLKVLCSTNANNKKKSDFTLAVLCDLSKAFDVISHDILLKKLEYYGLRGISNVWFRNYLTNRKQFVDYENTKSCLLDILCGVPQGSILGPLLYLLYVNDIGNASDCEILSFADDTTLILSDPDLECLYEKSNVEINKLYTWFCTNKLQLNANKTKYIVIKTPQKHCDFEGLNLQINGIPLSRVGNKCDETSTKFLGIHIDENLSWKRHICQLNSKIARASFAINQVKNVLPKESLKTLYVALIQPHINYGILAWGNASLSTLNKTNILQKRILRTINNVKYNTHTDPLFRKSEILKLNDLYVYNILIFMFEYCQNKLPPSFQSMFMFNHGLNTLRKTRQSDFFYIKYCKSAFAQKLPLYCFPSVWNKWITSTINVKSKSQFKQVVKSKMLASYSNSVHCANLHCTDCHGQSSSSGLY